MPLSADPKQKWPDEALELLRTWVNLGCRRDAAEPVAVHELIPPPRSPARELRVRKNIVDLSDAEAMISGPVPYWNWMSPHIGEDRHRHGGLPSAFADESYRHPVTGELRPTRCATPPPKMA